MKYSMDFEFESKFSLLDDSEKVDYFFKNLKDLYLNSSAEYVENVFRVLFDIPSAPEEVFILGKVFGFEAKSAYTKRSLYQDFFMQGMKESSFDGYRLVEDLVKHYFTVESVRSFPVVHPNNGSHYLFDDNQCCPKPHFQANILNNKYVCVRSRLGLASIQNCLIRPGSDLIINAPAGNPVAWTLLDNELVEFETGDHLLGVSLFVKSDRYPIGTYGHFLLDWLPEILFYVESGVNFERLMLPAETPDFVINILEMLTPAIVPKIFRYSSNTVYLCDDVLVSSSYEVARHPMNFMDPALTSVFFRYVEKMKKELGFSETDGKSGIPKRLYLSRQFDRVRRVKNESEILLLLSQFDFFVPELAKMKFIDQVILFSGASHIVAPHGSALSNIVFCQKSINILEFLPKSYATNCFALIASARGLGYQSIVEDTSHYNGDLVRDYHLKTTSVNPITLLLQYDYMVNLDQVQIWLEKFVNE